MNKLADIGLLTALDNAAESLKRATEWIEDGPRIELSALRSDVSKVWEAAEALHRAYEDAWAKRLL